MTRNHPVSHQEIFADTQAALCSDVSVEIKGNDVMVVKEHTSFQLQIDCILEIHVNAKKIPNLKFLKILCYKY